MIRARVKDEELIKEADSFKDDNEHFHLWWLGQSGFLVQWKNQRLLLDPYLSDSLTKKYEHTDKPHVRMSECVIKPDLLKEITVVTSTHNHTDHLDAETLIPVFKNNPGIKFIIPEANRQFVCERLKCDKDFPVGLDSGSTTNVGLFRFHGVPASHNEIEKDELGRCKFLGYVIRFDSWTIYHSGDTLWYDGMEELLKPFNIDLALLPINGNDPARRVAGNLDARQATALARAINAKMVIPCHYDMFTFNTADPKDFEAHAVQAGQQYELLAQGGHFSSEAITK